MRNLLLKVSLLAVVAAPLAARAASTDLITITGDGQSYYFTVPTAGTPSGVDTDDFFFNAIPTTVTGSPLTDTGSTDQVYFYDSSMGGGLWDTGFTTGDAQSGWYGPQLFGNSLAAPTFTPTSAPLTLFGAVLNPLTGAVTEGTTPYTFTVSAVGAPAATPEPSSLILLGTGALGAFGAFRRRIFA